MTTNLPYLRYFCYCSNYSNVKHKGYLSKHKILERKFKGHRILLLKNIITLGTYDDVMCLLTYLFVSVSEMTKAY